jgi:prolyl-tRNA synthetase
MKNKAITPRNEDFAKWYTDVVRASKLAAYSNVKGCIVIEPNGYAIWEKIQSVLDKMFKETGHQNVCMPMLIPENLMKKEGDLINGFAPEVAWVTSGGEKELDERMCIRPTSETLFSDYYAGVVNSYRDLPLKYNQWCSVLRWEKETRPFLRSREFLWQEGHTIHETAEEAEAETRQMLEIYKKFFEEYLAIPVITGRKTEKEKFAGAEYTLTIEALMYNGVSLQSGTSHYFGQKFSKAYDISFSNRENEQEYVYQTSWGVSTRMIGGLIMVHSDENGLVLPPKIAPKQVVIVPIGSSDEVTKLTNDTCEKLKNAGISVYVDNSEKSPGFKFAESEVNGIPVRIEIGERDLKENKITFARRDTREKMVESADTEVVEYVQKLLEDIQTNLYNRALARRNELTYGCTSLDEVKQIMDTKPGFIKAMWCGDEECELKMKEIKGTKSRCILENEKHIDDKCIVCGKEAKHLVVWGIQY